MTRRPERYPYSGNSLKSGCTSVIFRLKSFLRIEGQFRRFAVNLKPVFCILYLIWFYICMIPFLIISWYLLFYTKIETLQINVRVYHGYSNYWKYYKCWYDSRAFAMMKCFRLQIILVYIFIGCFFIYFVFIICRPTAKAGDAGKCLILN